jgi:hypothetical protein
MDRKTKDKLDYLGLEFTPDQIPVESRDKDDGRTPLPAGRKARTTATTTEDTIMTDTTTTMHGTEPTSNNTPATPAPVDRIEQLLAQLAGLGTVQAEASVKTAASAHVIADATAEIDGHVQALREELRAIAAKVNPPPMSTLSTLKKVGVISGVLVGAAGFTVGTGFLTGRIVRWDATRAAAKAALAAMPETK